MTTVRQRQTAGERREAVLTAALREFAEKGLHGASTDAIASAAGISQPYLFRLFATKKELFVLTVERCFAETHDSFLAAGTGKRGQEALEAMGKTYIELLADRSRLRLQLQAYAASGDPEIGRVVRTQYRRLVEMVERVSGATAEEVTRFFATGMLLNVIAAMNLHDEPEDWGDRLLAGRGRG